MILNAGCGGNSYEFKHPNDIVCDVNCDILKPKVHVDNFVLCDCCFLPFRSRSFAVVFAFNVLEHIRDYRKALSELFRVANGCVVVRLDSVCNFGNWNTRDHEYFTVNGIFVRIPRFVKLFRFMMWFCVDCNRVFSYAFWKFANYFWCKFFGLSHLYNYFVYEKNRGY